MQAQGENVGVLPKPRTQSQDCRDQNLEVFVTGEGHTTPYQLKADTSKKVCQKRQLSPAVTSLCDKDLETIDAAVIPTNTEAEGS